MLSSTNFWMCLAGLIYLVVGVFPGIPLPMMTPSWVPFPSLWAYLAGAILLAAGIALALNKKPRVAATSIGALMTLCLIDDDQPELSQCVWTAYYEL
jgi:hypothetical protein